LKPFFFEARDCPAQEVALAIGSYYSVSVLVNGDLSARNVTGRLYAETLTEAVESLAFLLGTRWRPQGNSVFFIGGRTEKKIVSDFPSYGLKAGELGLVLRDGASVVGDRVIVETDEMRASQIGEVLQKFAQRPALTLEIWVLDVSDAKVDYVNAWLNSLSFGAGYFQNTAIPYLNPVTAAASEVGGLGGAVTRTRGFAYQVDAQNLLALVNQSSGIKVDLREQIQVLSGGSAEFKSGDVLSDVTYQVLPNAQTQQGQVVSSITRRTVGLQVQLQAVCFGSNWLVSVDLDDSTLAGTSESTTHYTGSRVVTLGEPYFLLASFTRKQSSRTKDRLPVLSSLPLVGPVFTRSQTNSSLRNVMVLARPVTLGPSVVPLDVRSAPLAAGPGTAGRTAPADGAVPPAGSRKASSVRWIPVPGPSLAAPPRITGVPFTNQPPLLNGKPGDFVH
jgi:type II secretory pathway component GspD/PulD (secretin)